MKPLLAALGKSLVTNFLLEETLFLRKPKGETFKILFSFNTMSKGYKKSEL